MSASSMMTVIKNNRNLLHKRKNFKSRFWGYTTEKSTAYNLPKATSKQLKDIANRLKEEQKIRMLKVAVLTTILFLVLLSVCLYAANGITELLTY